MALFPKGYMNKDAFKAAVALVHGILPEKKEPNTFEFYNSHRGYTEYFIIRPKQNTVTFFIADLWERTPAHKKFYRYDLAYAYLQERILHVKSSAKSNHKKHNTW